LLKLQLVFAKICSRHWFLRKTPIFSPKIGKLADNCDHSIGPWLWGWTWPLGWTYITCSLLGVNTLYSFVEWRCELRIFNLRGQRHNKGSKFSPGGQILPRWVKVRSLGESKNGPLEYVWIYFEMPNFCFPDKVLTRLYLYNLVQ
jgi:hypothetical protein